MGQVKHTFEIHNNHYGAITIAIGLALADLPAILLCQLLSQIALAKKVCTCLALLKKRVNIETNFPY